MTSYYRASRGLVDRHGHPCHLVRHAGLSALIRFADGFLLLTSLTDVLSHPPKQEPKKTWKLPVGDRAKPKESSHGEAQESQLRPLWPRHVGGLRRVWFVSR